MGDATRDLMKSVIKWVQKLKYLWVLLLVLLSHSIIWSFSLSCNSSQSWLTLHISQVLTVSSFSHFLFIIHKKYKNINCPFYYLLQVNCIKYTKKKKTFEKSSEYSPICINLWYNFEIFNFSVIMFIFYVNVVVTI